MENNTFGSKYPNSWMSSSGGGAFTITGIKSIPSLVLTDAKYIFVLKGLDCKVLFVDKVVFAEDPLFAKILGPFVNGMNGLNNTYEFKFEEGQLAALMEEYFFFKEE